MLFRDIYHSKYYGHRVINACWGKKLNNVTGKKGIRRRLHKNWGKRLKNAKVQTLNFLVASMFVGEKNNLKGGADYRNEQLYV